MTRSRNPQDSNPEIPAPYTRSQWVQSVNISAVLGWMIFAAPMVGAVGPVILPWVAFFGLPIAFVLCWVFAAPLLSIAMRRPVSWLGAARWGATISGVMASVVILHGRVRGYQKSQNPHLHSQLGGGDYIREIDGILTPYGWQVLAQNTVIFVCFGIFIALIVRAIIGPGTTSSLAPD